MAQQVRLSDIAKAAGVSIATVGWVLSGSGSNVRVSAKRAEAIREIAEKMQYRPNINARTLAGQASQVIGVLIDSCAAATYFRIVAGIEREAGKHGYRVMIGEMHDSVANLCDNYQIFRQHGVDGTIVLSHEYLNDTKALSDCIQPSGRIVFVDPPRLQDASFVRVDRAAGVEQTVHELAARGRRRIGLIAYDSNIYCVRQRIDGYETALAHAENALPHLLYRIPILPDAKSIREVIVQAVRDFIIPRQVDALIAPNDLYAIALLTELQLAGLSVPGDMALVGHDNETVCGCMNPPLSSIDESTNLTAQCVVQMLLDGIRNSTDDYVARQANVKCKLIIRDSM